MTLIVYAVVDDALSPDFPLGVELEVFIRREDAERFIEEVRGDDPEIAAKLRIEERELEAGGAEQPTCEGSAGNGHSYVQSLDRVIVTRKGDFSLPRPDDAVMGTGDRAVRGSALSSGERQGAPGPGP